MNAVSAKRAAQLAEYSILRKLWLVEHPHCLVKLTHSGPRRSKDVHHKRGKVGRLLCDTRFFLGVCRECHDAIHACPKAARHRGLLAPAAEFNVYPRK